MPAMLGEADFQTRIWMICLAIGLSHSDSDEMIRSLIIPCCALFLSSCSDHAKFDPIDVRSNIIKTDEFVLRIEFRNRDVEQIFCIPLSELTNSNESIFILDDNGERLFDNEAPYISQYIIDGVNVHGGLLVLGKEPYVFTKRLTGYKMSERNIGKVFLKFKYFICNKLGHLNGTMSEYSGSPQDIH